MINMFLKWVCFAMILSFTAWIVPGINVSNFMTAMFVCVIISLINVFIRPIVEFISLPINFLTLGLFSFVINALLLMFAGHITPGFEVKGFFSALIGSILLSVFAGIVDKIKYDSK